MLRHRCDRCSGVVAFDAGSCRHCGAVLGYVCADRRPRVLDEVAPGTFVTAGGDERYWRCLNSAWGCNWMLPAGGADVWCRSCRLTRTRPDTADPAAVAAWMHAEAAKRRLVHQLDGLGLPIEARSAGSPEGLTFDLVHVPGQPEVTGHLQGVITLDLTEADDVHRMLLREGFHEAYRTVIGHLRHEIGHYFMDQLIAGPGQREEFRRCFGDERADYPDSLRRHHDAPSTTWHGDGFITAYASAHPVEDWAETFAHHLHITDACETLSAHQLAVAAPEASWPERLGAWSRVAEGLNAVAEGLGQPAVYPFSLTAPVIAKLDCVDGLIRAFVAGGSTR